MSDPTIWRRLMSNCDCERCKPKMNHQEHVDKMVKLALDFHIKTGVDIEVIKIFIRQIGDLTTQFAAEIIAEEFRKGIRNLS
jgi:hypothetical protein